MIHTNNPIIKHKAGLLNLAQELSNVSKACKVMGFASLVHVYQVVEVELRWLHLLMAKRFGQKRI